MKENATTRGGGGVVVFSCLVMADSLQPQGLQHARLLCPWDFSGKNIGVGCHFLLQGIFLTQGQNSDLLSLLHCGQVLYHLSHKAKPLAPVTTTNLNLCFPSEFYLQCLHL